MNLLVVQQDFALDVEHRDVRGSRPVELLGLQSDYNTIVRRRKEFEGGEAARRFELADFNWFDVGERLVGRDQIIAAPRLVQRLVVALAGAPPGQEEPFLVDFAPGRGFVYEVAGPLDVQRAPTIDGKKFLIKTTFEFHHQLKNVP